MFRQIVIGVDEHEGGRDAIALAKNLLARGGELTLAHVLRHDGHGHRGPSAAYEASEWASAAQLLGRVREETGVRAGDIEPHAAYGEAAEELALYGASLDLLVVGSRGYGPIGRLIHGSASNKPAHMARCPLLVLPRAARALDASGAEEATREPAIGVKG